MTKEEAIDILVNATFSDEWQGNEDLTTAYHMAIKAIEHEQALGEAFNIAFLYGKEKGMEAIDKALYQMGMDGIKEQEIKALVEQEPKWIQPSVKPQEPCEDAISRQAYIERFKKWGYSEFGRKMDNEELAIRVAMSLPPVNPQEPIDYKAQYESFAKKAEIVISQLRADRDRLADVFDKIRAEIEQTAKDYDKYDDYRRVRGLWIALDIIDKYKAESEGKDADSN